MMFLSEIAEWFKWLNETTGINYTIVYAEYDRELIINGFLNTIYLSIVCIFFSLLIGLVGAWFQRSRAMFRLPVQGYIQLFRNTPPLVQLYFFFFAVSSLIPNAPDPYGGLSPILSNWDWAIISLSFFAGAFNVEIFRSGIEAVPRSTVESAESLGFNRFQIYLYVILPLAFRISLPALNNNLVNLIKATSLAYAIGVPELLYASSQIWAYSLNVPEMMIVLLLSYLFLVSMFVWVASKLEKAIRIPGLGE